MSLARVLVIDDDPCYGPMLNRRLQARGIDSLWVVFGREGIFRARAFQPQLILMDMHLPDMDIATLYSSMRNDPETRHIPIILMTGEALPPAAPGLKTDSPQANPFYHKLDDLSVLLDQVDDILQTPAAAQP